MRKQQNRNIKHKTAMAEARFILAEAHFYWRKHMRAKGWPSRGTDHAKTMQRIVNRSCYYHAWATMQCEGQITRVRLTSAKCQLLFTRGYLRINETSPSNVWREFAVAWGKHPYTVIRDLEGLLYIRQVNHRNQYKRASKKHSNHWLSLALIIYLLYYVCC